MLAKRGVIYTSWVIRETKPSFHKTDFIKSVLCKMVFIKRVLCKVSFIKRDFDHSYPLKASFLIGLGNVR